MKAIKITYWITTAIIGLMMLYSGYAYLTDPDIKEAFVHLGFPDYFRIELAIAKLIGGVLLLVPVPPRVKEWTYAAFTIVFVSGFIAHVASGDEISHSVVPVVFTVLLAISYITYHKLQTLPAKTTV